MVLQLQLGAIDSIWEHIQRAFSPAHLPWTILWLGLATLIVGLIVLTRTSWGHSNSLQKCVAMSLLAHLLLAAYATTVQIVTAGTPDGMSDRGSVNLTLVNDGGANSDAMPEDAKKPWDSLLLAGPTLPPDALHLDAANLLAAEAAPTELSRELPAAPTKRLLEPVAPLKPADVTPPAAPPSIEKSTPPATPIETPAEAQAIKNAPHDKTATVQPDVAAPPRQQIKPDADLAPISRDVPPAANDFRPQTLIPTPDALQPVIEPSGSPKIDSPLKTSPAAAVKLPDTTAGRSAPSDNDTSTGAGESHLVPVIQTASNAKPAATNPKASTGGSPGAAASTGAAAQPELYKERTDSDRLGVLRKHGGSPETEAAVQAALKWLASHQSADGHWDADKFGAGRENNVLGHDRRGAGAKAHSAVTGLALLALMASGNTHRDGPYADNVRRGLNYLLSIQGADGNLGGSAELFAFMYCHGMATFAMSEAYAMTHDRRLEAPLRSAIGYTLAAQHPTTGGWRYQPRDSGDTSQLGWQLMSLKSAELAGIKMPESTRSGAIRFLKSVVSGQHEGLGSYRPYEAPSRAMTAEALVCRQFLGMARENPAENEAGDYLLGDLPNKDKVNLYYWYYGTVAMFQLQGDYWQRWNSALQSALLSQQSTAGDTAGSWEPNCIWGGYGGRVYSTAMSALCLEIYYRYLPLYNGEPSQPVAAAPPSRETGVGSRE